MLAPHDHQHVAWIERLRRIALVTRGYFHEMNLAAFEPTGQAAGGIVDQLDIDVRIALSILLNKAGKID